MCRILEPLTMPPPAASPQRTAAQQELAARSQTDAQQHSAPRPTAHPEAVAVASHEPCDPAAVGRERDVSPQPNSAAQTASPAASAVEGRAGVQGSALDAQSHGLGKAHRQEQLAEPAALSAQHECADRNSNSGGTDNTQATLVLQSMLSPTHLLQLVHIWQMHSVSLLADRQGKDEVPAASFGVDADTHVAALEAADDDVTMDEQDMDKFLLELHAT